VNWQTSKNLPSIGRPSINSRTHRFILLEGPTPWVRTTANRYHWLFVQRSFKYKCWQLYKRIRLSGRSFQHIQFCQRPAFVSHSLMRANTSPLLISLIDSRYVPDILSLALGFKRNVALVSVSMDGIEMPKVYAFGESISYRRLLFLASGAALQ